MEARRQRMGAEADLPTGITPVMATPIDPFMQQQVLMQQEMMQQQFMMQQQMMMAMQQQQQQQQQPHGAAAVNVNQQMERL